MFKDNIYWKQIENFLPEHNRITEETAPEEKWCSHNKMEIRYDEYSPDEKSDVSVVLLHGVGGNGRLLSFIAVPLVKAGFNVICPDLPGYGYTRIDGNFDYSAWIDAGSYITGRELEKGKKIFLIGLSAGGMLAWNVACRVRKIKGLIVTNILDSRIPTVRDYSVKNRFFSRVGIRLFGLIPGFTKKIKIPVKMVTNMSKIVNRREMLKILLKDKTGSGSSVSAAFLLSMIEAVPLIEPEEFTRCPVLLTHPEDDRWTPVEISRLFFDRIKAEKKLVILENAGHFPIEQPGLQQLETACISFIMAETGEYGDKSG